LFTPRKDKLSDKLFLRFHRLKFPLSVRLEPYPVSQGRATQFFFIKPDFDRAIEFLNSIKLPYNLYQYKRLLYGYLFLSGCTGFAGKSQQRAVWYSFAGPDFEEFSC